MGWTEIRVDNLEETLEIIEDALCYGFEFKVENHKVFYREQAEQ